ncbi:MAG: NAD kinase [Flavobacteriales bacterium]|nr:NAD kinase [Flavobacteriales bacterium]MCB9364509.1 NAD kinase [Flavobacteriales bacterium]
MKVAIYSRELPEKHFDFVQELFIKLLSNNIEVFVFSEFYGFLKHKIDLNTSLQQFNSHTNLATVDFLFSIGGDGTLLETSTLVRERSIPVMGINTGRLGFLSTIATNEIDFAIESLKKKEYHLDTRSLLSLDMEGNPFIDYNLALNEVTLQKKDTSAMITIHAYLNGVFLNTYWADGLIIATPTGSTAYSLSCNGPIVLPNSGNIIITPIAPHNLNVRPLVIPDNIELTLKVEGRTDNFLVALDSRSASIPVSSELRIKKSKNEISLIRLSGHDYLNTLRNKLMWGVDKRN